MSKIKFSENFSGDCTTAFPLYAVNSGCFFLKRNCLAVYLLGMPGVTYHKKENPRIFSCRPRSRQKARAATHHIRGDGYRTPEPLQKPECN